MRSIEPRSNTSDESINLVHPRFGTQFKDSGHHFVPVVLGATFFHHRFQRIQILCLDVDEDVADLFEETEPFEAEAQFEVRPLECVVDVPMFLSIFIALSLLDSQVNGCSFHASMVVCESNEIILRTDVSV